MALGDELAEEMGTDFQEKRAGRFLIRSQPKSYEAPASETESWAHRG